MQKPCPDKKTKNDDASKLYENICIRYGIWPQKFAKNFLMEGILNVKADRLKPDDWIPILEILEDITRIRCIRIANVAKEATIKTTWNRKKCEIINLYAADIKTEILLKICQTLKKVLTKSRVLECLILDNVRLETEYVKMLCDGLHENRSLLCLSFENCKLGNENVETICLAVKNSTTLAHINFANCNMTWKAMQYLVNLIKQQSLIRHNSLWQNTLRYQRPELENISGLREVNLNNNPAIGDKGVQILANGLTDDLWIKAIDLEECGLTDDSAKLLLSLLKSSVSLAYVNIWKNSLQDYSLYEQVHQNFEFQTVSNKWKQNFLQVQHSSKLNHPAFKTGIPGSHRNTEAETKMHRRKSKQIAQKESQNTDAELKKRLADCLDDLEKEKLEHLQTKEKLYEILQENASLKESKRPENYTLVENSVLSAVEATFKRFQELIQLLKTSRLGNLGHLPQISSLLEKIHVNDVDERKQQKMSNQISGSQNVSQTNDWIAVQQQASDLNYRRRPPELVQHRMSNSNSSFQSSSLGSLSIDNF